MMYFCFLVYFLVIFWIQGGETQFENKFVIRTNATSVLPNEPYTITCYSTSYNSFNLTKNHTNIVQRFERKCQFETGVNENDYECIPTSAYPRYELTLTVLHGEKYPTTAQWDCVHPKDDRIYSSVNITVRNSDPRRTTTHHDKTASPTQPPRQSSSSSPPGQPPVSSTNNVDKQPNIILIAIVCSVVVCVLVITVIAVMFVYNKRKKDLAKLGSTRPIAREPMRFQDDGTYVKVDKLPPPKYDWNVRDEDFVSLHETLQVDSVPESSNPNFDASKVYGVVCKNSVANSKDPYGGDEAGKSNPNFDADKVYGVVDKSAN
ncbi:hypothetical protein LOTGIDRAFT_236615 [Lottia gigantea]|uniref:Uncharacterized protein n=1 Tax=Lottia gigantea TaxID=225164 RepID=V3YYW5_LOTGI|nr:hypothetical protein LOTGIDRAFT_236615 [Lottia gigantea]ESO83328.1 hypothetical protein LOTGIDRAFT_236615 [Lottia gigantea]